MKKFFVRSLIIIPTIILQIFLYTLLFGFLREFANIIIPLTNLLAIGFVLYLLSKRMESNYKISWIIVIILAPVFGAVLYLFFGNKKTSRSLNSKIMESRFNLNYDFKDTYLIDSTVDRDLGHFKQIEKLTGMPTYKCENATYYESGEVFFENLIEELKKAKKFIFIEFFIVENGELFKEISDILIEKVKEGVDVRFMYDDFGSLMKFSLIDLKRLIDGGVKCLLFNPVKFLDPRLNNRDHRKMVIVDGEIAFSGGNNLADEYANIIERFGYWKDVGFSIKGRGVNVYSYMFMEFWNAFSSDKISESYLDIVHFDEDEYDGIVASYYDSPFFEDAVSNSLYVDILSAAKDYVWIYTPYLILPNSLNDAIIRASHRGIDVRIIMPGIPDKKMVYRFGRSYYSDLLYAGVRIFTYTPGFLHAKAILSDDNLCTIGTVNLDFRSLYLHFENNSLFYHSKISLDLKKDLEKTISNSSEIYRSSINPSIFKRINDSIFRIIAPLF